MKLQILSDLHLEYENFTIPETDADVIVLAGDIHERTNAVDWIKSQTDKPVIYVAGNHEYYGHLCPELKYDMYSQIGYEHYTRTFKDPDIVLTEGCKQINFLEKDEVFLTDSFKVMDDLLPVSGEFLSYVKSQVRFLGCTLWTPHSYPFSFVEYCRIYQIRKFSDKKVVIPTSFTLSDAKQQFEESIGWLGYKLKQSPDFPTMVVTHHAPSYQSNIMANGGKYISDEFPAVQDAYMNELENFILEHQSNLKLWVHGHLHCSSDYMIGNTRVVCNPRGRDGQKNPDFDPKFTVEIGGKLWT